MKYLIEWALKALLYCTIGSVTQTLLLILAFIMWDKRFFNMADEIFYLIWGIKTKL